MRIIKHAILVFILLNSISLFAQNDSAGFKRRTSLLLHAGTPEFFGVYVNHYLNNRFSLNAGLGFNSNFHLGSNFYFIERSRSASSFYTGAQFVSYTDSYEFWGGTDKIKRLGIYIPLGYEFVGKKGFTLQFEAGPAFLNKDSEDEPPVMIFFAVKIGITTKRK